MNEDKLEKKKFDNWLRAWARWSGLHATYVRQRERRKSHCTVKTKDDLYFPKEIFGE